MTRKFARAGAAGGRDKANLRRAKAYQQLFAGNGSKEDAEIVLSDLADITGYYRRPSYGQWIANTKTPQGFELHSALSNARAEVLQHIMDMVLMDEDQLVALERAARAEAR